MQIMASSKAADRFANNQFASGVTQIAVQQFSEQRFFHTLSQDLALQQLQKRTVVIIICQQ